MVGEGEKSGCECGAGETAGDVGVGEGEGACRGVQVVVMWRKVAGLAVVACL